MKRSEHREDRYPFSFIEYSPEERREGLPLIIHLHGIGERGAGKEELNMVERHGLPKLLARKDYECVVVFPQCPLDTHWSKEVDALTEFINMMIEEYGADRSRIYLTGLSMGGYGTWAVATEHPDIFAAIVPVCGGGTPSSVNVLKMPIWVFHGAADDVVDVSRSDEMVEALEAAGADVKYTRPDGVGHNVWELAYNEELMEWLLSKEK